MTSYSALAPVSAGIFGALNTPAFLAIAPGGAVDDVPQSALFPVVLYELAERPQAAFGVQPGVAGAVTEIDGTVHVYSQYGGLLEAQTVLAKVVELLTPRPTVAGFASWAIFFDEAIAVGDELLGGVKVKELVAKFRLYVETLTGAAPFIDDGWVQ